MRLNLAGRSSRDEDGITAREMSVNVHFVHSFSYVHSCIEIIHLLFV